MVTVVDVDLRPWTKQDSSPIYDGNNPFNSRGGLWPDASTTGVPSGTTLTPSSGFTTSSDGQVIDSLDITGTITVKHNNVSITKSRITASSFYGVNHNAGTGLVIDDCEVSGASSAGLLLGGSGRSAIVRRAHVHDNGDNCKFGSDVQFIDGYIHGYIVTASSHNDAIQIVNGDNITISGSRIDALFQQQTAAVIAQTNVGPIDNLNLLNNRFSGGTFTVYITDKGNGHGAPTNVTVTGNTWEQDSWSFGSLSFDQPTTTWVWNNNVFSDGTSYPSPL